MNLPGTCYVMLWTKRKLEGSVKGKCALLTSLKTLPKFVVKKQSLLYLAGTQVRDFFLYRKD